MKVFSTLKSDQIDLKRSRAEGIAGLKAFLEYAEKGRDALHYNTAASSVTNDGFVEAVAEEIRKRGFNVRTNIGCSGYRIDIGIVNPDNHTDYILGILCDGYNYTSSKSSRDREIVQIGILRKLGWEIARVWAMDWWNNKEGVMTTLVEKIKAAIDGKLTEEEEQPLRLYSGESIGEPASDKVDEIEDSTVSLFDFPASFDPDAHHSPKYTFELYKVCELRPHPISYDNMMDSYNQRIVMGLSLIHI